MLIYPIYPDYQNQNGLTYNPSARFDLNHMNGYHENDCGYSLNDMNGLTYMDAPHVAVQPWNGVTAPSALIAPPALYPKFSFISIFVAG